MRPVCPPSCTLRKLSAEAAAAGQVPAAGRVRHRRRGERVRAARRRAHRRQLPQRPVCPARPRAAASLTTRAPHARGSVTSACGAAARTPRMLVDSTRVVGGAVVAALQTCRAVCRQASPARLSSAGRALGGCGAPAGGRSRAHQAQQAMHSPRRMSAAHGARRSIERLIRVLLMPGPRAPQAGSAGGDGAGGRARRPRRRARGRLRRRQPAPVEPAVAGVPAAPAAARRRRRAARPAPASLCAQRRRRRLAGRAGARPDRNRNPTLPYPYSSACPPGC